MQPVFNSNNPYKVLGLPETASQKDIKKAYKKLSLEHHPDKGGNIEIFKKVSDAYHRIDNEIKRKEYDLHRAEQEDAEFTDSGVKEYLHVGRQLSKTFKAKIRQWTQEGPSLTDRVAFQNLSSSNKTIVKEVHPYTPLTVFEKLTHSCHEPVESILSLMVSEEIWKWKHNLPNLAISRDTFNSSVWSSEYFSPKITLSSLKGLYTLSIDWQNLLNSQSHNEQIFLPDISHVKTAVEENFAAVKNELFSFPIRHAIGTKVPMFSPDLEKELGFVPYHIVKASTIQPTTDSKSCNGCHKPFGLFLWKYDCKMCGNVNCDDCQTFRQIPDYTEPVRICNCCSSKITKTYSADWITPLNDNSLLNKITNKYLLLIDELGFANRQNFLKLVQNFMRLEKFDLAIQCHYSGGGDWFDLACQFISLKKYYHARVCLNHVKFAKINSKNGLTESEEWIKKAQEWMNKAVGAGIKTNDYLILACLCYIKAGYKPIDYVELALKDFQHIFGKTALMIAIEMTPNKDKVVFLNQIFDKAMNQKNYLVAVYCFNQLFPSFNQGIEKINALSLTDAEILIQYIHQDQKIDWKSIRFHPDKDHLRWPFLGQPQFETWLNDLFDLLKKCDGQHCIPYFKSHMKEENFIVHRDQFLENKEYEKALICHCLSPNKLDWETLAKKWRTKDGTAAFICYLLDSTRSIEAKADQLFNETYFKLALRCYLISNSFDKIKEKAKKLDSQNQLRYQLALWRQPETRSPDSLITICQILLTENKENQALVQKVILSALKEAKTEHAPTYYQFLIKIGLSDLELLGLLQATSKMQRQSWYQLAKKSALNNFRKELYQIINQGSFKDLFPIISNRITPQTLPVIQEVLNYFQIDILPLSDPRKAMGILIRALTQWMNPNGFELFEIMNLINQAMLSCPNEECIQFCTEFLDKISQQNQNKWRGQEMTRLPPVPKSEYTKILKSTPPLRTIIQNEKAIDKMDSSFEASMALIDLCMALHDPASLASGFLKAASELLVAQQSLNTNQIHEKYAYRRAIAELVLNAYVIGNKNLCPATQLYILRSSIAILTISFKSFSHTTTFEKQLTDELYREVDKLIQIAPFLIDSMVSIYDSVYLNLIYNNFSTVDLDQKRRSSTNPIFQYYLFEGTWKGWIDESKFTFQTEREKTMQALLQQKGNKVEDVENLMNWSVLIRDSEGWLPKEPVPLNLEEKAFSKIHGIRFNLNTGDIELLLVSSKEPMENVFDMQDVSTIMKKGILGAQFTLEQPNTEMHVHPYQEMRYTPASLSRTHYLATLLHGDVLLKMLSMNTEINSKAPFDLRDADKGFLERLPEDLRKEFSHLREGIVDQAAKVHRFWIEASRIFYEKSEQKGVITYSFSECEIKVNKHLMRYDHNGKLVDTDEDLETDSMAAKFAKLMTEKYDTLGQYFPELLRIKELAKIQVAYKFALEIYYQQLNASAPFTLDSQKMRESLKDMRDQITYPLNCYSKIEECVEECLRKNGVTRYQIPSQKLNELKEGYAKQLQEADIKRIQSIINLLQKQFPEAGNQLEAYVKDWLSSFDSDKLIQYLKEPFDKKRDVILKICKTFDKLGFANQPDQSNLTTDTCTWIPAAFNKMNNQRVYGGVNMNPQVISSSGGSGSGSGSGSRSGSGSGGMMRGVYRESMSSDGRLHGNMTCYNPITNTSHVSLNLRSAILDQWNLNQPRSSNVAAYWEPKYGTYPFHHYTSHTSGSYHNHTTTTTTCVGANGNTQTFNNTRGERGRHRCDNS